MTSPAFTLLWILAPTWAAALIPFPEPPGSGWLQVRWARLPPPWLLRRWHRPWRRWRVEPGRRPERWHRPWRRWRVEPGRRPGRWHHPWRRWRVEPGRRPERWHPLGGGGALSVVVGRSAGIAFGGGGALSLVVGRSAGIAFGGGGALSLVVGRSAGIALGGGGALSLVIDRSAGVLSCPASAGQQGTHQGKGKSGFSWDQPFDKVRYSVCA